MLREHRTMQESIYGSFSLFILSCWLAARLAPKCFPTALNTPIPSHCPQTFPGTWLTRTEAFISFYLSFHIHTLVLQKVITEIRQPLKPWGIFLHLQWTDCSSHTQPHVHATPKEQKQNTVAAHKMLVMLRHHDSFSFNTGAYESCHIHILALEIKGNIPYVSISPCSQRVLWWEVSK